MSIKVDIISGFLGAGKTTLIKQLFKAGFSGEKVVLIENEFGEIGIDGTFLKEAGIDIKEINSGCICCSLVGDFSKSMEEVINKFNPDRIIIEPSGVGKLSDIIKAVENLQLGLVLNIVATVVDGLKCKIYMKNFGEFFNNQVEDAKSIIISKVENLEDEKIIEVYNLVKNKNPHANIILANLPHTDEKKLLEVLEKNALITEQMKENLEQEHCHHHHNEEHECCCHHHDEEHEHCCHHHDEEHEHCCQDHDEEHECCCHHHDEDHEHCCHHHDEKGHHHDADEIFVSYGFESVRAYSKEELTHILDALKDENVCGLVLRAKGILRASDNDNWYYFDYVSGDYQINEGKEDFIGRFVVIGSKLNKENIEKIILIK
ncbi:MAG TPA: cobalamin biosynthesis protein CobW [Acholeplasmatales bacterium]|nr:cobalamin biosynthesis protein CobW [Acholeplasmatales bacterium]